MSIKPIEKHPTVAIDRIGTIRKNALKLPSSRTPVQIGRMGCIAPTQEHVEIQVCVTTGGHQQKLAIPIHDSRFDASDCIYESDNLGHGFAVSSVMNGNDYAQAFEKGIIATRGFLLRRGAPMEDAEELAQAAWARGWEYREQLREPSAVGYWVNSIASNLFRAKFRKKDAISMEGMDPPYTMNLEEIELRIMLDRCPEQDRALLERSLQGYSSTEIAREQGITSTGIRVRMLRIRRSLRGQLRLDQVA